MNTTSTIALPASCSLSAASPIAGLTHALRSLGARFEVHATRPDFMERDPKDLLHEFVPAHPAERLRRDTVDRVLEACPYLR